MDKLIIKIDKINDWLERTIQSVPRVIAPVAEKGKTEFRVIKSPEQVCNDSITTVASAKAIAFPPTETLFSYHKEGKTTALSEISSDTYPKTVLWRARPCDAMGFLPLTGIFNWDYKDNIYNARHEKLTIVSFSCTRCDEYCFCTSVGGGPGNEKGSDVLVTFLGKEEALVEVLTDKGKALTALVPDFFKKAPDHIDKEVFLAEIPVKFSQEQIRTKLTDAFNSPIWKKQSERCLGCGVCAYVCPTCACFDIQEDAHGNKGRRVRCWDSCGFSLFTQHTSGYNPRPTQSTRWRQRVLHKFLYMPDRIGQYGCTGCGRCSRACPVDMNIQEHLISIADSNHE